ncbi:MAG TPA: TIR domain-containing protein, partial [Polyangiaceae bacterium]
MTTDERVPSAPSGPIFLSYARGDGKDTAKRLRDALGKGAKVWQDIERIEGGDWAREIQLALGEAQTMVALLTPCAVGRGGPDCRRDNDSVCLDEIYYARFAPRPVPIVPVMVRNCEPPFVIYRLHYHDFTQVETEQDFESALEALKKDLARAGRGETQYRSFVDRLAPLDFENFLGSKRRGFVGRDWLFQEVATALSKPNVQALLIEGQAGLGKSSFLAEFIHRNQDGRVMAYHCCQADTPSTLSCAAFVRTVASMIASQHPPYAAELDNPQVAEWFARDRLEQDPASAFEQGILAPLAKLPPPGGGLRLLVIDALDEALLAPPPAGGGRQPISIVELLSTRHERFPAWLKLLATTRPEHAVKDRLTLPAQVIKAEDPRNGDDLSAYIRARLRAPELDARLREAGVSAPDVETKLSTLAAGNFLYASQVLDEIAGQMYAVTDLDKLPPTLKQKYTWFFARQFPTQGDFAPLRELLEVVVAAETALPHADLARALRKRPEQLEPVLARLASFIRTEPGPAYAVFHKSMVEWLTDPARAGQTHFASSLDGHARIADGFLEAFENDGATELSRYALAYLPAHLAACADGAANEAEKSQRLEQLVRFVLDAGVQSHEFQRPSQLAESLRLALARAARGPAGHCLRLVFESAWGLLAFRRSRLKPERMFALAAAGDLDGFARELDAYHAPRSAAGPSAKTGLGGCLSRAAAAFPADRGGDPGAHRRRVERPAVAARGARPGRLHDRAA